MSLSRISWLMYNIVVTSHFKKQLKRLVKKNRSLKADLIHALEHFQTQTYASIGRGLFKMRLRGQGKGKSGGYRVYIFVMEIEGILAPISIYSKNEKESLSADEITYHLERTKEELEELL